MNKTIAQLVSVIFYFVLMSPTTEVLAVGPGHNQWTQQPGQDGVASNVYAYPGQLWQAAPRPQVGVYPDRERRYRFRPWEGRKSGFDQSRRAVASTQPSWRPANPVLFTGYPGQSPDSRYRFRPMEVREEINPPPRWTYRPAQIEIPNHYVYRPIKAKRASNSVDHRRLAAPVPPAIEGYGYTAPRPGMIAPGSPPIRYLPNRYLPGYNPAWQARWNPGYQGYRADIAGYPAQRRVAAPRYTANMPVSRYRFRPLNQPGPQAYPYPGERARYAANPYFATPGQARYMSGQPYPYPWYRYGMPPRVPPTPAMARAGWRPLMPNPYGVDWYDGQADGEGAWYKLAEQQQWPRVSQHEPLD